MFDVAVQIFWALINVWIKCILNYNLTFLILLVNFVDFLHQVVWVNDSLNYNVFVKNRLNLLLLGVS